MSVQMKILITDPAQDIKKVLRFAPPLPANPAELTAWLLRQFDPSGAVSERTHELVLLSGEELREAGVLTHSSQIHNGLRLRVRLRNQQCRTVAQQQPSLVPLPQRQVTAHGDARALKARRFEVEPHQQQQAAPAQQVSIPRFVPPPLPQQHQEQLTLEPSGFQQPTAVPPQRMNLNHHTAGFQAPPPPPKQVQREAPVSVIPPITSTNQSKSATQHQAQRPQSAASNDDGGSGNGRRRAEQRVKVQQLSLDDAVDAPRDLGRVTNSAKRSFAFLTDEKSNREVFAKLSASVQRNVFREFFLIMVGATGKKNPPPTEHKEGIVNATIKRKILALRKSGQLTGASPKSTTVLYEAWVRGIIVFDPKCEIPSNESLPPEMKGKSLKKKRKAANKLHVSFVLAPEYEVAAHELLCPITEELKVLSLLEVLSAAKWPQMGRNGPCGFQNGRLMVANDLLKKELTKGGNVSSLALTPFSKGDAYTVATDTTKALLEAVRALLLTVTAMSGHFSLSALAHEMLNSAGYGQLPSQIATINVWKAIIKWTTSRGLLNMKGTSYVLSAWSLSDKYDLTCTPSKIDLRLAEWHSLRCTRMVMSTFVQEACLPVDSSEPEEEEGGVKLDKLWKMCNFTLQIYDQEPTLCWCLFRLVKLGLIELRRNGAAVTLPDTAVKLDEATTTIHATDVLRNSVVCRTPLPQLLEKQSSLKNLVCDFGKPYSLNKSEMIRKTVMSASCVVACSLECTNTIPMSLDMLTNEARWALTLHGQHEVHLAVSQQEVDTVVRYVQESGLVTWDVSLSGFVVTPGLFDTMYYLFLLRLKTSLDSVLRAKPPAATNNRTQKKQKVDFERDFFERLRSAMNCYDDYVLKRHISFSELTFTGFLDRARAHRVVDFTRCQKGGLKKSSTVTLCEEKLSSAKHSVVSRPQVDVLITKLNAETDGAAPPAVLLVPSGINAPHIAPQHVVADLPVVPPTKKPQHAGSATRSVGVFHQNDDDDDDESEQPEGDTSRDEGSTGNVVAHSEDEEDDEENDEEEEIVEFH